MLDILSTKRLKINKKLVTGAIVGKATLYDVKKYNSAKEIKMDQKFHYAAKDFHNKKFGFVLKNAKPLGCDILDVNANELIINLHKANILNP